MQLTKYTHACVRFDDGDRTLVIDPGAFSEIAAALDGADAVLITHEHFDHVELEQLREAATRDPRLRIWAPEPVAAELADLGEQVAVTAPGQAFDAAGFAIRTFGGQHAVIHPSIPVIPNVGYLVNDAVFHPGDSLVVPAVPIEVLLAPVHAPWSSTANVIDFVVSVRAPHVYNLHDSLLTPTGQRGVEGHVARIGGEHGSEYRHLDPAETVEV